jgi:hypothetical protein
MEFHDTGASPTLALLSVGQRTIASVLNAILWNGRNRRVSSHVGLR